MSDTPIVHFPHITWDFNGITDLIIRQGTHRDTGEYVYGLFAVTDSPNEDLVYLCEHPDEDYLEDIKSLLCTIIVYPFDTSEDEDEIE